MKITAVNTYYVRPRWGFVEIETDEGYTGWGEAVLEGHADAVLACVNEYKPYLVGHDPSRIEDLNATIYRAGFYRGGGVLMSALSGIDQALWDIKGKATNLPVYKLLGGKVNSKIKAYASQIQLGWGTIDHPVQTPEDYAREAKRAVSEGFTAVKVDPLWTDDKGLCTSPQRIYRTDGSDWEWKKLNSKYQLKVISDRVGAIRDAVGDNVGIVIELHGMCDVNTSIQIGRELDQYGCLYYEEPGQSMDYRYIKELHDNVQTCTATGERIGSLWGFKQFGPSTWHSRIWASWAVLRR